MVKCKHSTLKASLLSASFIAVMALTACQSTGTTTTMTADEYASARQGRIDSALEKAAGKAAQSGKTEESIAILEKVYKRNSDDPDTATRYARALRKAGHLNRASMVISPFARNSENTHAASKTEFAAIQAALGNYSIAEEYARRSITEKTEDNPVAYHVLGIALDSQGAHEEAEASFRKALDTWSGNPSLVMNNLGLNLAAQGDLAEAIATLEEALNIAPNRMEIERNLRIVKALQGDKHISEYKSVPKPSQRPDTNE